MRSPRRPLRTLSLAAALSLLAAACAGGGTESAVDTGGVGEPDAAAPTDARIDAAPDLAPADVPPDEGAPQDLLDPDDIALQPVPGATTTYRAGAAEAVVNPETDQMMGGFGFFAGGLENCRWSEGVHDDLKAVAFAIEEAATGEFVVFVGLDALGFMIDDVHATQARFAQKVHEAAGRQIPGDRLIISASHAHSTPDLSGIWGSVPEASGRDPAYATLVQDGIAQAAADAYLALQDATIRVGRGWFDNEPDVATMEMDGTLTIIEARTPAPSGDEAGGGAPIGSATFWGSHPTAYGDANTGLSADWVGPFRHQMHEASGGGVHAHIQGNIGGVYPVRDLPDCDATNPFTDGWMDPDLNEGNHDLVACVGYSVADAALVALADAAPLAEGGVAVRSHDFDAPLDNALYQMLSDWDILAREIVQTDEGRFGFSTVSWARVGQLDFVTMPGESFPRYAAAITERLVSYGAAADGVVHVGLGNDWTGYLLLPEQYFDGDYSYHRGLSPGSRVLEVHLEAIDAMFAGQSGR